MAHLDFESECFQEEVALWLIEFLSCIRSSHILVRALFAATVFEHRQQIIKLLIAVLLKIHLS
jgi:hypothetical protein